MISVSDGALSATLPAFTLTVTNVNDAPTITGSPAVTVAQGAVVSFTPTAADVSAGTTLTFSIANKPSWASFNTATGAHWYSGECRCWGYSGYSDFSLGRCIESQPCQPLR